ncbi:MAG: rod shape-determining protein [Clostridia bacterium]|nr:rod shape-determining protein [Clostridia bacterium]
MKQLIALKLGSTMTTIFKQGEGLVLKEPSMIAISGSLKSMEIKAVGKDAKRMQGRIGGSTNVVYPINNGVITDSELATAMLKAFLRKVFPRRFFKPNIKAILCAPLGISLKERKTFEKVCYNAGIADVTIIPAIICSAVGDDIAVNTNTGKLLVNIGGGTTNIAVMAMNNIVSGINISIGGTSIDKAVENLVAEKFNLRLGDGVAQKIKEETLSLLESDTASIEVQGINITTKENESKIITSKDIYPVATYYYGKIAEAISGVINTCPPDIINDIKREGLYLFGSNSEVNGIAKFYKNKLGINVVTYDHNRTDIIGAAKILDNPTQYQDLLKSI